MAEKRSDHPAPMIMPDIEPYKSMVTGEMITGRKQHRDHLRARGLHEIGNDVPSMELPAMHAPGEVAGDIKTAIDQVRAGYVPPPDPEREKAEDPKMEPIDARDLADGAYVRSDAQASVVVSGE